MARLNWMPRKVLQTRFAKKKLLENIAGGGGGVRKPKIMLPAAAPGTYSGVAPILRAPALPGGWEEWKKQYTGVPSQSPTRRQPTKRTKEAPKGRTPTPLSPLAKRPR
jgi:hypothetical protein